MATCVKKIAAPALNSKWRHRRKPGGLMTNHAGSAKTAAISAHSEIRLNVP